MTVHCEQQPPENSLFGDCFGLSRFEGQPAFARPAVGGWTAVGNGGLVDLPVFLSWGGGGGGAASCLPVVIPQCSGSGMDLLTRKLQDEELCRVVMFPEPNLCNHTRPGSH